MGVVIAFRIGLFVVSVMADDDPPPPVPLGPTAVETAAATDALDNPLDAVLGECYDTGRQVTSCAVPHQGEVITALILEEHEADRASADRRCRWYVDHELGGSIPRGTDVYAQVPAGEWDRGFLPVSCVVEARPGQPLLTGRLRQPRPTD